MVMDYLRHLLNLRRKVRSISQDDSLRIVLGSSGKGDSGWILTDIHNLNVTKNWHFWFVLGNKKMHNVLAEHVWEHLTWEQGVIGLKHVRQFLKEEGVIRIAVPDGFFPSEIYINHVKPGGTGAGALDHKILFNHQTLTKMGQEAGFSKIELIEWHDEKGVFHIKDQDWSNGKVFRSRKFDKRNSVGTIGYTSLIIDFIR